MHSRSTKVDSIMSTTRKTSYQSLYDSECIVDSTKVGSMMSTTRKTPYQSLQKVGGLQPLEWGTNCGNQNWPIGPNSEAHSLIYPNPWEVGRPKPTTNGISKTDQVMAVGKRGRPIQRYHGEDLSMNLAILNTMACERWGPPWMAYIRSPLGSRKDSQLLSEKYS